MPSPSYDRAASVLKRHVLRSPASRWLLIPYRAYYATSYFLPGLRKIPRWLLASREYNNFGYELARDGKAYAISTAALVTGARWDAVAGFADEFDDVMAGVQAHASRHASANPHPYTTDARLRPGRPFMSYLLTRGLKPKLAVEAGTADGLGTCVLAAAVERNEREGHPGAVLSIDLDPMAGWLVRDGYARRAKVVTGDVRAVLSELADGSIGLYAHDTSNDPTLERTEFDLLRAKLEPSGVVQSAWHTKALVEFARQTGRQYLMFFAEPLDHWYPGMKWGIAFTATARG